MRRVQKAIGLAADSQSTVLIFGETGTGKELVARALHVHSRRKGGPFIAVNCAAIPPDLLESELFGHVKGSFTGATGDRTGAFSWRLSANHLDSLSQPLGYATLTRPASTSTAGTPLSGAFNDFNRTGAPIVVIGDTGLEHQVQDTDTLKLTYDFADGTQLSYLALFCSRRWTRSLRQVHRHRQR